MLDRYVMGTATALTILFGLKLHWGVLITGLDTFLALGLQHIGIRSVEAVVGVLFGAVTLCYIAELMMVRSSACWHSSGERTSKMLNCCLHLHTMGSFRVLWNLFRLSWAWNGM